jgi:restriction endonuclease S subunit
MAAQKNINLKILRELESPLSDIREQNKFAERIETIEKNNNKLKPA